jgi:hypothetical protein
VCLACRFQPFQDLSEEDQQTVKHFNQRLQDTFDVQFPKGSNPDLQLMQHLWEPLRVVHKPLMIHVFSEMSTFCTHALLQVCNTKSPGLAAMHVPLQWYECVFLQMTVYSVLQALRFERYEFMGFTYWAHGLHPPEPEELPAGTRKLSALQSLFVDLHSLLNSDDQGVPGPMDFLSTQARVRTLSHCTAEEQT